MIINERPYFIDICPRETSAKHSCAAAAIKINKQELNSFYGKHRRRNYCNVLDCLRLQI